MSKNYGVKDILAWEFDGIEMPAEWRDHLGDLHQGARILVKGNPKHGKTEYLMQMSKMLATHHGKVSYNSTEQGKSKTFQAAARRNRMSDIRAGKFVLCEKSQKDFETWFKKLQGRNTGRVLVLDSADYMGLTFGQYKQLNERFPNKTIIVVAWMTNPIIKQIEYMMDAIVHVKDFKAQSISRLGGNKAFIIWHKQPEQAQLFK